MPIKKNGKVLVFLIAIIFIPVLSFADIIAETDIEVKVIAEPVLENILNGFKENDYDLYSSDFDATLKESVSKSKFLETDRWLEDSLGILEKREYLGFLKREKMTIILWKGQFSKSESDVLIKLVMSKREGKFFVTGLWFQ